MALFGFNKPRAEKTTSAAPEPSRPSDDKASVYEVSDQTFAADVIEASRSAIILVDFWAPWCGPCKQLGPLLEAKAEASRGKIRVAKIDIDQHQAIAGQLRIQSIPAVYAFFDGRPLDGFVGAVTPKQVDQFIERLLNSVGDSLVDPIEELLAKAQAALESDNLVEATEGFGTILQTVPEHPEALAGLAMSWLKGGDPDKASTLIDTLPDSIQDHAAFIAIRAAIKLALEAGDTVDMQALEQSVRDEPENLTAKFELAKARASLNQQDVAVELLLDILRRNKDWEDGAARQYLITIFEAWGDVDPRTAKARRQMAMLIF